MDSSAFSGSSGSRHGSQEFEDSTPPVVVLPASAEFSGSISYDAEAPKVWKVPKSKVPKRIIRRTGSVLKKLLDEQNITVLKRFIQDNILAINYGKFVRDELVQLCRKFAPSDTHFTEDMDAVTLMKILSDVLEGYQRGFALFDVSLESAGILEGSALSAKIDKSRQKVSDFLESMQKGLNDAEENVWHLQYIIQDNLEHIKSCEEKIQFLTNKLVNMQERYYEEPKPDDTNFFMELREHLEKTLHLNSTFKEELAAEKRTKHSLLQEIFRLKELRVYDEQQKMKEISDIAKDLELDEGIRRSIVERIQTLSAQPEEIHKAVNDWMNEIHSYFRQREKQVRSLKQRIADREDEIAKLTLDYTEVNEQYGQLLDLIRDLDDEVEEKLEELESKQNKLAAINELLNARNVSLQHSISSNYYDATSPTQFRAEYPDSSSSYYDSLSPPRRTPDSSASYYDSLSPFERRTPDSSPSYYDSLSPTRRTPDPSSPYASPLLLGRRTPDSPPRYHDFASPLERTPVTSPEPLTIPKSLAERSPESSGGTSGSFSPSELLTIPKSIAESSPESSGGTSGSFSLSYDSSPESRRQSTPKKSGIISRINVGESFNMRVIQNMEPLVPFTQVTRVDRAIEGMESNRMVDAPFKLKQRVLFTPPQSMSPSP